MSGDEHHLFSDHFVCRRNRLLGIARIVRENEIEPFTEHPTLGVDVGDRHLGAAHHLLARSGLRAGDRPDHRDRDILRVGDAGTERERRRKDDRLDQMFHMTSSVRRSVKCNTSGGTVPTSSDRRPAAANDPLGLDYVSAIGELERGVDVCRRLDGLIQIELAAGRWKLRRILFATRRIPLKRARRGSPLMVAAAGRP